MLFLTFTSLFYSIVYLVTFNTNSKLHFLTDMLTHVSYSTPPSFNLCMFIEGDGTTNNEDKRILNEKKMLKFTQRAFI